ncbi:MAG: hypothetical protein V4628_09020 [Pseudomonadota bacterium]
MNKEHSENKLNNWRVKVTENGRCGSVLYTEPAGSLSFSWEFGGGNTVASIYVETEDAWRTKHPWAAERRIEILQRIASEVIRQKSPTSHAEMDETGGWINLCETPVSQPSATISTARAAATVTTASNARAARATTSHLAFRERKAKLMMILAAVLVAVALVAAGLKNMFSIDVPSGSPLGLSLRTPTHIATLIQTLEPYVPSLNRNAGDDRYSLSLFLYPLDGDAPGRMINIATGLGANDFNLVRLVGSDNETVWFNCNGVGGVNLETGKILSEAELRDASPSFEAEPGSATFPFTPDIQDFLSAGVRPTPTEWLGLHSPQEAAREYQPGARLSRVNRAEDTKELRRFYQAQLGPELDRGNREILSLTPVADAEFLNAAFVRTAPDAEPLRLNSPESFLITYTSTPGLYGTLMLARVDVTGKIIWQADTGIDRFKLTQILPDVNKLAVIGTRPPLPGKVSEPILVIVDNQSGALATSSLWQ